ncbi:MAG: hypothetical protein HRT35_23515 [Algicola sp.]|nr:hypothetical protein [Algicola sp.]
MRTLLANTKPARLLSVLAFICISFAAQAGNDKDKSKHKIKFKVLQNTSYGDCAYAGEVVLDARYKFHKAKSGQLSVQSSSDGQSYVELLNLQLDGRRGHVPLTFDGGQCSKDLRLTLNAD